MKRHGQAASSGSNKAWVLPDDTYFRKCFLILRLSDQRRHPSTALTKTNPTSKIASPPNSKLSSQSNPSHGISIHPPKPASPLVMRGLCGKRCSLVLGRHPMQRQKRGPGLRDVAQDKESVVLLPKNRYRRGLSRRFEPASMFKQDSRQPDAKINRGSGPDTQEPETLMCRDSHPRLLSGNAHHFLEPGE
jgi:hypothetical protein